MLLAIVSWKRIVSWMTMPIWRRRLRSWTSRMSWPSIRMAPESTSQNRGSRFISVVLPQPLGPTRAIDSPCRTVRLIPLRTGERLRSSRMSPGRTRSPGDGVATRWARLFSETFGRRSMRAQIRSAAAAARWILEWTLASLRIGSDAAASMV